MDEFPNQMFQDDRHPTWRDYCQIHFELAWRTASRLGHYLSREDREEICWDSVRQLQAAEKQKRLANSRGAVVRIAARRVCDKMRKDLRQKRDARRNVTLTQELETVLENPDDFVAILERAELLGQFKGSLSGRERELFNDLCQGKKHREISEERGLPMGTVATKLRTLKINLEEFLKENDD